MQSYQLHRRKYHSLDPVTVAWLTQLTTSFGSNPSSTQITEVNSPAWTPNQGYAGNGVNSYLNTNYNYSTDAVNASRNNMSHGIYSRTDDPSTATNMVEAGASLGNDWGNFIRCGLNGNVNATANTDVNQQVVAAISDTLGLYHAVRNNATQHSIYKNGALVATANFNSLAHQNFNDFVLGRNTSGSMNLPTNKQISMRFIGAGNINQVNFYSRFQTFATTIGFNV